MRKQILLIIASFFFISVNAQKFDGLAATPPMGWNSWNKFGCDINEKLIMEIADAMVSSGMAEAGYEYVVIDDCWQVERDKDGEIIPDPERFPHGIKYLADYIHSKGLKFGIYSCAGTLTCEDRPGGRGYEYQDARTYASWGVDYLKYDWCHHSTQDSKASYSIMRDALYLARRPIVFSICEWGRTNPWEWAGDVGHLWRTTGDIVDRWDNMIAILDKQKGLEKYAGPGHWNDPDMLQVGNGGMTYEEYKAHFSLWCILSAPLMAGNDLRDMDQGTINLLVNEDVISINQDTLGNQGFCFRDNGDYEIWIKKLSNEGKAACLFNRSDEEKTVQVDFNLLLRANNDYWKLDSYELENYLVWDLWNNEEVNVKETIKSVKLPPHSVKLYRFIKN